MATRSRIAIENQDGSVTSVYCHWDGHIESNGVILNNNYNTTDKVNELIGLGDLSSLYETTDRTISYHRDNGEDLNQTPFNNVEDLFDNGFGIGIEYVYCFTKDGIWLVGYIRYEDGSLIVDVLDKLLKEQEA
jgi:hypothetical protein